MIGPRNWSRFRIPLAITVLLLGARLAAVPPLADPVAGPAPDSLRLSVPALYLLFAPVFSLWDGISMLSMRRLVGLLSGMALLYLLWRMLAFFIRRGKGQRRPAWYLLLRELAVLLGSIAVLVSFLLLGALWHRPMLALSGVPKGERVVDFHSHTRLSHDVRGTLMDRFDAVANQRWHARAGFDAAFITDHNTVGRQSAIAGLRPRGPAGGTVLCPGIEISAWRAHIVLLGETGPVDRNRYSGSLEDLLRLLETSDREYQALSVASLPEYRRNHWNRLDTLIGAGLDGFEVVNASPKANEITRAERDTVIRLARSRNRFVVGVSDSHGWGATSMVWNLVQVPSQTRTSGVCASILEQLQTGFGSVKIIERHRLRGDAAWPVLLTPIGVVWETWRSMGWALTISWLCWVWALGAINLWRRG
jgi:hypothetical protein